MWFFLQLKTFIEKPLKTGNTLRQTRYQAADLRYDYDDVIFSSAFAYINAQSHARYEPYEEDKPTVKKKRIRYVQDASTNFRLRLAEVNGEGKIIRYVQNPI